MAALKICMENLPNQPETAATMLFAGKCAKRCKEHTRAVEMLKEALKLFKECLENHFMTALCLKVTADIFLEDKSESGLEKSLSYYKEALRMMEKLEMDGHEQSIFTLSNYGVCHKRKGNFMEAS